MTDFRIAALSLITPWTVTIVCLILLGISVYYCALDKAARDRRDREIAAARREDERRERARQVNAAGIAKQRTRDTERRMRAADRDGAA